MSCACLLARPMRGFRPRGRVSSLGAQRSDQENRPDKTTPAGSPAMLEGQGRAELAPLRSVQTSVASQCLKRASLAPWPSALVGGFKGGVSKQPNSQQPGPQAGWRRLFNHPPFSAAEERKTASPFAQRTSRTDSVRLSDRSVAKGVPHGGLRSEHHREPAAQRRAARSGATFCLLFGRSKRRSAAGANSRLGPATKQAQRRDN
jgi:hypothetical protein